MSGCVCIEICAVVCGFCVVERHARAIARVYGREIMSMDSCPFWDSMAMYDIS